MVIKPTNNDFQALTGRRDAYFVGQNWLGVADGVGQWSFEGILYILQYLEVQVYEHLIYLVFISSCLLIIAVNKY